MSWDFIIPGFLFQFREISRYQKGVPEELEQRSGAPFIFRFQYQSKSNLPKSKNLKEGRKIFERRIYAACDRTCKKGCGYTNPNPLVGAVIVKDQKVIGEGYHEKIGGLHAERNALKNCIEDPKGAEIYVTLEPLLPLWKNTTMYGSN